MIWYDLIRYDMIWSHKIWYIFIRYDMIWYHIKIWYDMIDLSTLIIILINNHPLNWWLLGWAPKMGKQRRGPWSNPLNKLPSLKLTWHLKMDGWNTILSFWEGLFSWDMFPRIFAIFPLERLVKQFLWEIFGWFCIWWFLGWFVSGDTWCISLELEQKSSRIPKIARFLELLD